MFHCLKKKSFIVTLLVIPTSPLPHLRKEPEDQVSVQKSIISPIKGNYDLDSGKCLTLQNQLETHSKRLSDIQKRKESS